MKKNILLLITLLMFVSIVGCSSNQSTVSNSDYMKKTDKEIDETNSQEDSSVNEDDTKTLIIYFSESGNTETIANYIHEEIGGDIVRIIPTVKYPETYDELADYAKIERDNDERPIFNELEVNPEDYDVIFIGYPIWWYTLPMIMYTFFETYDFSSKTIIPFNTHEGSRDGGTYKTIGDWEPNAKILEGLPIRGRDAGSSKQVVLEWLEGLDY